MVFATLVLALAVSGCSNLTQQLKPQEPKAVSADTKGLAYLNKETISLEDTEKLFKSENIKLVMQELEKSDFGILQQKYPTVYYINNDKNQVLSVYVFASKNERAKARAEYDKKTATMSMVYGEIYEAKNIMVILRAGAPPNEYYQKISSLVQKVNVN